jgi:hypothetical protein
MALITCPTGCETALPITKFDDCNPVILLSEIETVYLGKPTTTAFTDVEDPTEWATRLSQTAVDADAIRPLTVIADKAAGAPVVKDLSNGRKKQIRLDQTLNVEIDDASDENYNFVRTLQACGGMAKMWYKTKGGKMYGGNNGIENASVVLSLVQARGADEIEKFTGTVTWSAVSDPERNVSAV